MIVGLTGKDVGFIVAAIGAVVFLLSPFVISWGQVVEDTRRTADNTELLVKRMDALQERKIEK